MAIPSKQIGWGTESNLLWQILKQLTQLTNVIFGLKPKYKVFTALLTQSGTGSTVNATSGLLIVGVSYLIDVYNAGDDFSNVGGPAAGLQGEWDGYSFLATGTTPNNWNNLSGLEYNTGAPVVTVLENTIGNIWFTYSSIGTSSINSNGLFTINKTAFLGTATAQGDDLIITGATGNDSSFYIQVWLAEGNPAATNGSTIEIRVYN